MNNNWISVDERLPGRQEKVIVCNKYNQDVWTGQILAKKGCLGWVVDDDDFSEFIVTHWQPLHNHQ